MDPQNMGPVVVPDMVFGGFGGLRQLETLETSEGSDSVRRHLLALKQAEMMEFQREVQLHRMEDEAKELPMRQQLEELHEEWQRFRVQCEHERQAAEMQEDPPRATSAAGWKDHQHFQEQILLEMSSLTDHRKRQEQDMSPDTSKERRSKSRQALGARSSSEGGKASGRGLELERRDPVPSSHWGSQELDLTPQHNVVGPPIHLEDGPGRHSGPPGGASRGRSDQEERPGRRLINLPGRRGCSYLTGRGYMTFFWKGAGVGVLLQTTRSGLG
eukprot:g8538.t1